MSEIHIAIDIPPVLTGSPIPVTVNLRLTDLEAQVGVTGSTDPLSVENRLTVAQADIVTAKDTVDAHIADVANPHSVTKTQLVLGNVDNTSDIDKPVSTAQALADDAVLAAAEPVGAAASAVSAHAAGTGVHTIAATTGLQAALDSKSGTAHNHTGVYDLEGAAAAAQAAAIAASAPVANGVTNGDSHNHSGGYGGTIAYSSISGTPTLGSSSSLDVGTTANKIVQLDGAGKLPAVDGSQLTGITGGSATQSFGTISVSGQSNVVADAAPDTLTIVGVGAAITTDSATDTITITAEASGAVSAHAAGSSVHTISATTGLQTALDGKSSTSHNHTGVYDPAGSAAAAQAAAIAASAPSAKGVTNGDSHDHSGGDGAQIDYSTLSNKPSLGTSSALNVGTTSGTVAAGDDSRIVAATAAETTTTIGALINGATAKATPVDVDQIGLMDSAASNILKKLSWSALKTALQSIFATLAGTAGGQTINGGTAASETLTLRSTAHATKGKVIIGSISAYDEVSACLGIGTTSPTAALHIKAGTATASTGPLKLTSGTLLTVPEAGVVEYLSGTYYLTNAAATPLRRKVATEEYILSRGLSLITNGNGGMLDNTNFSTYTYDNTDTFIGAGSFRVNVASGARFSDDFVPVSIGNRYILSFYARSGDEGGGNYNAANLQYVGLSLYDIDKNLVGAYNTSKYSGSTDTTLAVALNPGDSTVTLTDGTGWYSGATSVSRNFAWYGYANSYGYIYPNYTYTRLISTLYSSNYTLGAWSAGGISGNVITLRVPWAGPAIAAGAAIRNVSSGSTYKYIAINNSSVPNAWTKYSGYIGPGIPSDNSEVLNLFRPGVASVKIIHLVNYHGSADNNVSLSDISINQISSTILESSVGIGATYKTLLQSELPTNGLAVQGKMGAGTLNPSALVSGYGTTEQARSSYDATTYISTLVSSTGLVTETLAGTAAGIKWLYSDATTNAIYTLATFSKNSTGAGAAGLGPSITLAAKSSTTVDSPQVTLTSSWVVATHATRTARGTLNAVDYNGTRESFRWESDGTVARLGFFGATAVVKPTALTAQLTTLTYTAPGTPDYAIADVTQSTPFGFTTADEARTILSVIKNLQDRVGQLETKLQGIGLLT